MNNVRGIIMLIVALCASVGAVIMAAKWLHQRSAHTQQVVVATEQINMGQRLSGTMFKLIDWPDTGVPPGAITELNKIDGRVTKTNIMVGELLLSSKLAPEGSQGGLSAVIAEGKRAITVRVNDVVGVAGFALPGNFVDILVNTKKEGVQQSDTDKVSKIVLEHILVLAVAQEVGRDATTPKVVNAVTLEVTPEQAEKIDLARSIGELSLVLRNQVDVDNSKTVGITKESLFGTQQAPVQSAPQVVVKKVFVDKAPVVEKKKCTKVISGLTESIECF